MPDTPVNQPDPAKRYRVKLARAVEVAPRVWARPSTHEVILLGCEIAQHGDAITSHEEV
jgi:predicted transcriptional regulator